LLPLFERVVRDETTLVPFCSHFTSNENAFLDSLTLYNIRSYRPRQDCRAGLTIPLLPLARILRARSSTAAWQWSKIKGKKSDEP
jgi:hypothetical protein